MIKKVNESSLELIDHEVSNSEYDSYEEYVYTYGDYTIYYDVNNNGSRQVTIQNEYNSATPYVYLNGKRLSIFWGTNGATSIEDVEKHIEDVQFVMDLISLVRKEFDI